MNNSPPRARTRTRLVRGDTAVVTGASSGIGRCIAIELARRGVTTVLVARSRERLESLANELSAQAPSISFPIDLADHERAACSFRLIQERHGPVNVLVNCAGMGVYAPVLDHRDAEFQNLFQVNAAACMSATQVFLPDMLELAAAGRAAHVVSICSMSARLGPWGHSGYAASKAAMRAFTESLACELHGTGVGCSIVFPGIIDTPYFEHVRVADLWRVVSRRAIPPERVARAVIRALHSGAFYTYVPWHYQLVDVIAACSPRLAASLVRRNSMPHAAVPRVETTTFQRPQCSLTQRSREPERSR